MSVELPSSKRRRVKEDSTGEGQQTEDEETKQTEGSKSHEERKPSDEQSLSRASSTADDGAAAAAAAAASAKPKSSKGRKAAPPTHMPSPFAQLDLDSLSIVLSMLSSDDFLSAIRVNKHFYAARLKKSAWPALQLDSFIQSLRDDDYDNPARRRLRLRIPSNGTADASVRLLASASTVFGSASSNPSAWPFVTDVQLYNQDEGRLSQPSVDVLLPELARLPCLTAVNFHRVIVSAATFEQFCVAVAPRLEVLLFESARVADEVDPLTHVGLLRELRVLVVNRFPPMEALLQLHQLVYLHVSQPPSNWDAAFALRRLCTFHALHSLSLGEPSRWVLNALLPTMLLPGLSAAQVALVDWHRPLLLTDLSCAFYVENDCLQQCVAIPTLTRLQVLAGPSPWESFWNSYEPLPLSTFTRLQQLRLQLNDAAQLDHLAQCSQLRVLQLSSRTNEPINAKSLCAIVSANAATLEGLRFSANAYPLPSVFAEGDTGAAKWSVLAECMHLRVLELPLTDSVRMTPHLLSALAKAPAFQSLELALTTPLLRCQPQVALLPSALSSSSWCSVRLIVPETTGLRSTAGLAKFLPPSSALSALEQSASAAALRRLRLIVRCESSPNEYCFALCQRNVGLFQWQSEY